MYSIQRVLHPEESTGTALINKDLAYGVTFSKPTSKYSNLAESAGSMKKVISSQTS